MQDGILILKLFKGVLVDDIWVAILVQDFKKIEILTNEQLGTSDIGFKYKTEAILITKRRKETLVNIRIMW